MRDPAFRSHKCQKPPLVGLSSMYKKFPKSHEFGNKFIKKFILYNPRYKILFQNSSICNSGDIDLQYHLATDFFFFFFFISWDSCSSSMRYPFCFGPMDFCLGHCFNYLESLHYSDPSPEIISFSFLLYYAKSFQLGMQMVFQSYKENTFR